jgi:hypothetical protein
LTTNATIEMNITAKETIFTAGLPIIRGSIASNPANSISLISLSENRNARTIPEKICTNVQRVKIPTSIQRIIKLNL